MTLWVVGALESYVAEHLSIHGIVSLLYDWQDHECSSIVNLALNSWSTDAATDSSDGIFWLLYK